MMLRSVRCASCAFLLASSLATLSPLVAQEEPTAASVVLDELLDERESEIDAEAMEKLSQLMAEPLNLQEADDEAVRALPLLPSELLERLIAWRNAGTIRSYAELHAIAGMTEENLRLLKAMTRLRDPDPRQRGSILPAGPCASSPLMPRSPRALPSARRPASRARRRVNQSHARRATSSSAPGSSNR